MIDETIDGRYEIVRFIGEGGMGEVYEARHVTTRRRVAIKIISDEAAQNPERLARFKVEAKAAGRVDSDHITQVFDLGYDDERDKPYMAMELLEGEDLEQLFERRGKLPLYLALRVVCQALYGLSMAHQAGVTHRDIKPANIFLCKRDNGRRVVKLLDFGIAKIRSDASLSASSAGITTAGTLIGSPAYMSPEQTKSFKNLDPRTDVWSMGVVLHQAVLGETPFANAVGFGDLLLLINSQAVDVRQSAPWVPDPIAQVINKALTVDGEARYQDATEMLAAVEALLPDGPEIEDAELDESADLEELGQTLPVDLPSPSMDQDELPTVMTHHDAPSEPAPITEPAAPVTVREEPAFAVTQPGASLEEGAVASADEGAVDEGSVDEGSVDEGSVDEGDVDEGVRISTALPEEVPMPLAVSASPAVREILIGAGAVAVLVIGVVAFALRSSGAPTDETSALDTPPAAGDAAETSPEPADTGSASDVEPDGSAGPVDAPKEEKAPMPTARPGKTEPAAPVTAPPAPAPVPSAEPSTTLPPETTPPEPAPPETTPPEPPPETTPPEPPPETAPPEPPPETAPPEPPPETAPPEPPPETAPPEPPPEPAPARPPPSDTPPIAPKL